jgi:hypothetical protein
MIKLARHLSKKPGAVHLLLELEGRRPAVPVDRRDRWWPLMPVWDRCGTDRARPSSALLAELIATDNRANPR